MKPATLAGVLILAGMFSAGPKAKAQGTIHLSNLEYPTSGSLPVGSDAWIATWFQTGPSPGGYVLDSIQLSMGAASGSPTGFSLMLWDFRSDQSIADLAGPDPLSPGVYTYESSGFVLSPSQVYWFAVTSGTPVGVGAYNWSYESSGEIQTANGWILGGVYNGSEDGMVWSREVEAGKLQFAVNATPIPEPSSLALLGWSGFLILSQALKRRPPAGPAQTP